MDSNTNITVSEGVEGQASLETFTLLWGGVPSLPLPFNASEAEVFLCFIFLNIYHWIKCWLLQYCVQNILNALLKYPFSTWWFASVFLLKMHSALDVMVTAKCPAEIPTMENTNVKFFRDYETTTTGVSKPTKAHNHVCYNLFQVKLALQILSDIMKF